MAHFKNHIAIIVLLLVTMQLSAQNPNANWFFGQNAGVTFTTNPPTSVIGSAMNTTEGCASVSDPAGNLLFYTDGSTIWDQNHVVMANGTGLNSHQTTTQSSIIIRRPGSWTEYYVFSLTSSGGGTLSVSIVDLTLAGTGSVTVKNQQVGTGLGEKLCYTQHCNGIDWWVVGHADLQHTYYAWLITGAGVSSTPVTSSVGIGTLAIPVTFAGGNVTYYSMKISPGGDRIAKTVLFTAILNTTSHVGWQVSNFNNSTGVVSGLLELRPPFPTSGPIPAMTPYGVEFSPDGSKLYGSLLEGEVFQWDLCAGSDSAVDASRYTLTQYYPVKGALQAAPDGKIYVSRHNQPELGVINNPNVAGSGCNYVDQGLVIAPAKCQFGLPNLSPVHVPPPPFTYTMNSCFNASFTPPPLGPLSNYVSTSCSSAGFSVTGIQWNFGDPASGSANTSTLITPTHSFSGLGTYTAMLVINYSCRGGSDTIRQVISITQPCFTFTASGVSCASAGSATVAVLGLGPYTYTWLPGLQTGSVATGIIPGTYSVLVTHVPTSITFSYQAVFPLTPVSGTLSAQQSLRCAGVPNGTAAVTTTGTSGNHTVVWTNGPSTFTAHPATTLSAGTWSVYLTDNITGCTWDTSFVITQPPLFIATAAASSPSACVGSTVTLTGSGLGGTPAYVYSWVNGPAASQMSVSPGSSGTYVYTFTAADSQSCLATTTVAVQFVNNPTLSVTHATSCPGATVPLVASGAITYTWSNSATGFSAVVSPTTSTNFTVTGSSFGCSSSTMVSVNVLSPPNVIIGVPGSACEGKSAILNASGGVAYLWSGPGSFTSSLQSPVITSLSLAHDGTYTVIAFSAAGCTASATGYMQVRPVPTVAVTGYSACTGENLVMTATVSGGQLVTWQGPGGFSANGTVATISSSSLSHSGNYSVVATSTGGCVETVTLNVFVLPQPVPLFTLSTGYLCAHPTGGSPVTLTITVTGAPVYSLQLPSYLSMISSQGATMVVGAAAAPNQPTAAIASATITGDNHVCSVARTIFFSIVNNPVLPALPPAPEMCAGETFTFSTNGAGSYTWSAPGATLVPAQGSVTAVTATANVLVSVTGNIQGCLSEPRSTNLTVHALPLVVIQPDQKSICLNQQATLTALGNGTGYEWLPVADLPQTASNSVVVQPSNTTVYTVVATANNCTNAAIASVIVWPLPQPTAGLSKDTACVGNEIILRATGGEHYMWQAPTGGTYEGKNVNLFLEHKAFSGVFNVTVTDTNGCVATASTALSVYDPPAGFLTGPLDGCSPFCTQLTFSATSGDVDTQWSVEGKKISGHGISHCFKNAGTYTVAGRFTDPLTSCISQADFLVTVRPGASADFYFDPEEPVESVDMVEFRNSSTGDLLKDFEWYVLDHTPRHVITENISHVFETAGTYKVLLVAENEWGCFDTVAKKIIVRTDFNVYIPNSFTPNGDGINDIFFPVVRGIDGYHLRIFDRWGEQIFDSFDPYYGWDGIIRGQPAKQDAYVWMLDVIPLSGERKVYRGHVTLLR